MEKLIITTVSPIHVGTGEELGSWDFIAPREENRVYFPDFNKIKIDPGLLTKTIEEEGDVLAVLKKHNIRARDVSKYILKKESSADIRKGIRELIKNVNNRPYIPGTEIKGAIRTAILWWVLRNDYNGLKKNILECLEKTIGNASDQIKKAIDKKKERNKWETMIGNEIEKIAFGDDPQKDILKALYIGDTGPFAIGDMGIV
jgi:CRISPR-associated protein Csm5